MRTPFDDQLTGHPKAYEGLVSLTIGERPPVDLWARVFHVTPELVEITTPPTRIRTERSEILVHLSPERPDLPPNRQPPTWPPPFPPGSAASAAPYCRISVTSDGRTESLEQLRLVDLDPYMGAEIDTWDALLSGTL